MLSEILFILTLQNALLFQAAGFWEFAKYTELCSENMGLSSDEKANQFYEKRKKRKRKRKEKENGKKEKTRYIM